MGRERVAAGGVSSPVVRSGLRAVGLAQGVHAGTDGVDGGQGVYAYGAATAFPSNTYNSENYWVDVVFVTTGGSDATPPSVSSVTPVNGAGGVATTSTVSVTLSEAMDATTLNTNTIQLRNPAGTVVPAAVAYNASTRTATLTPSAALAFATTYTASVRGGTTDPRAKDTAGNALGTTVSWSFTTLKGTDTTAPTVTTVSPTYVRSRRVSSRPSRTSRCPASSWRTIVGITARSDCRGP